MFPFFNVARPGQLSSTHLNYFTSFFRAVPDVLSSSTSDYQLSSSMHLCMASLLHVQFYLRFLYTRFPHLRCLHADSITRAIHMMYFTRYFHNLRNPYPQNNHYPQFHYTRIKSPRVGINIA